MAAVTNTFQTTSAVGNREELSDVVSRITPEDTPIYSLISKGTCKSVHPEWETDELAAPAENIQLEGDDYTFDATTPPTRLGNYTQIMRKSWIISNTQETVDEAGNVRAIELLNGAIARDERSLIIDGMPERIQRPPKPRLVWR